MENALVASVAGAPNSPPATLMPRRYRDVEGWRSITAAWVSGVSTPGGGVRSSYAAKGYPVPHHSPAAQTVTHKPAASARSNHRSASAFHRGASPEEPSGHPTSPMSP